MISQMYDHMFLLQGEWCGMCICERTHKELGSLFSPSIMWVLKKSPVVRLESKHPSVLNHLSYLPSNIYTCCLVVVCLF